MEALEKEYRINEQGMILEYLERLDNSIKGVRTLSLDNVSFITSHQSNQNLAAREEKPA